MYINKNKYGERVILFLEKILKKRLEILNLILFICTGYSFEIIMNAFTISSLIQISIKLLLSLVTIKLNLMWQLGVLLLLVPVYLKYNTFDYIRTKIANFLWKRVPEELYMEKDDSIDDYFYEEEPKTISQKISDYCFSYSIYILISFRLLILQEPILSLILKFMAIRYFFANEWLLIAYTISFVFIFSRFIFLLSDGNIKRWKLSLGDILNEGEVPKINKKNIKIMTHWALRDIYLWEALLFQKKRQQISSMDIAYHLPDLKDKFDLNENPIVTNKQNIIFKISFFLVVIYFYKKNNFDVMELTPDLLFIAKINKNLIKIHNKADAILHGKLPGHMGVFREKNGCRDVTPLSTLKALEPINGRVFPYKHVFPWPPLIIPQGFQSISMFTKILECNQETENFYMSHKDNLNISKFHDFNEKDLKKADIIISSNNIMIKKKTLIELTPSQELYLRSLTGLKKNLPITVIKKSWSIFEPEKFSEKEILENLISANLFLTTHTNLHDLIAIQKEVLLIYNQEKNLIDDVILPSNIDPLVKHLNNKSIKVKNIRSSDNDDIN